MATAIGRDLAATVLDVSEWFRDPGWVSCSALTKGVSVCVFWFAHCSPRYGYLMSSTRIAITPEQIAQLAHCSQADAQSALRELESTAVICTDDATGTFRVPRMVDAEAKRGRFRAYGKQGGNPQLKRSDHNGRDNPPNKTGHASAIDSASSLKSYSSSVDLTLGEELDIRLQSLTNTKKRPNSQSKNARFTLDDAKAHPTPMGWPEPLRLAWDAWIEGRWAIRKPLTPRALDMALAKLSGWPEEKAVKALQNAAIGGWQGIHEPEEARKVQNVRGSRKHEAVCEGDEKIDVPVFRANGAGGVSRSAP